MTGHKIFTHNESLFYARMTSGCDNISLWCGTWRVKQKVEQPNIIAEKCKIEILGKELLTMASLKIDLRGEQVQTEIEEEKDVVLRNEWYHETISSVTLYGWPAKQTIPLSVLARNQTKGFRTWNLGVSGSGNGTRKESWLGKGADESWRRDTDRESRQWTPEQRGEAAWHEGPATVKNIESRCRHSSCFVEFSLVIHASVSPYMLSEM